MSFRSSDIATVHVTDIVGGRFIVYGLEKMVAS